MGADKASVLWGDLRAVDRVVALAHTLGAGPVLNVGGSDYGLGHVADPTPLGGPVGGILAGLAALAGRAERVIVLAVDAPTLTPEDLAPLLAAAAPGACYEGLPLPMLISPAAMPQDAASDWPLRRLAERTGLRSLPVPPGAQARLRGANTAEERDQLLREAGLA
jgi:molybdenum cofactor guanylyltransferase